MKIITSHKRSTRYRTGIIKAAKCVSNIRYRSSWELEFIQALDKDDLVKSFEYEPFAVPYISNQKTKKIRRYYPDFFVTYSNGTRKIIEIKRDDRIDNITVRKKADACRNWIKQTKLKNTEYEIWTSKELWEYKRKLEMNYRAKVAMTLGWISPQQPLVSVSSNENQENLSYSTPSKSKKSKPSGIKQTKPSKNLNKLHNPITSTELKEYLLKKTPKSSKRVSRPQKP